jgi:hypothetical protein
MIRDELIFNDIYGTFSFLYGFSWSLHNNTSFFNITPTFLNKISSGLLIAKSHNLKSNSPHFEATLSYRLIMLRPP